MTIIIVICFLYEDRLAYRLVIVDNRTADKRASIICNISIYEVSFYPFLTKKLFSLIRVFLLAQQGENISVQQPNYD